MMAYAENGIGAGRPVCDSAECFMDLDPEVSRRAHLISLIQVCGERRTELEQKCTGQDKKCALAGH